MTDKTQLPSPQAMTDDGWEHLKSHFAALWQDVKGINSAAEEIHLGQERARAEGWRKVGSAIGHETMKELPELNLVGNLGTEVVKAVGTAASELAQRNIDFVRTRPVLAITAMLVNPAAPLAVGTIVGGTGENQREAKPHPVQERHNPPAPVAAAKPVEVPAAAAAAQAAQKPVTRPVEAPTPASQPVTKPVDAAPAPTQPVTVAAGPRNGAPEPVSQPAATRTIELKHGMSYWREADELLPEGASNAQIFKLAKDLKALNHNKYLYYGQTMEIPAQITT